MFHQAKNGPRNTIRESTVIIEHVNHRALKIQNTQVVGLSYRQLK